MRHPATLVLLAAAACTAHNPNYNGDGGNGSTDLAGVILDLSGPMGPCSPGQRMCAGTQASDRCEAGMFVVDRNCPAHSQCMATYCAFPSPGVGTQIGQRCDATPGAQQLQCAASISQNLTCQPFVDPSTKELRFFCDSAVGPGAAGSLCTRGSDCRSGFCGSNNTCFEACQSTGPATGCSLRCQSVSITVEGVTKTVKSCIP